MANADHIAQLMKGSASWNAWRSDNPDVRPDLSGAKLHNANLREADLSNTDLSKADLSWADLCFANFNEANLVGADLSWGNLGEAKLIGTKVNEANLSGVNIIGADFTNADLTGCRIYGISAWNVTLKGVKQQCLVITPQEEPAITVDNIEVAQFIYLLLRNDKIRKIIDTVTAKVVLILGRFTAGSPRRPA
jgi:hypothetical protein